MVEEVLTTELQSHSSTPSAQFDQDQEKDKGAVRSKSDSGRNTKVKSKSAGKSESQSEIEAIMDRIKAEQCNYVGIYKPGELGRGTWRAVIPSTRRQRGRGHKGKWESVVLSTEGRSRVNILIDRIKDLVNAYEIEKGEGEVGEKEVRKVRGVRHILNPQCDQDEGLRIIWSTPDSDSDSEMDDWERRDQMRKEGKTVRAISRAPHVLDPAIMPYEETYGYGQGQGQGQMDWEPEIEIQGGEVIFGRLGRLQHWDNTAWNTLSPG